MAHTYISCSFCGKREDLELFRTISSPLVSKMRTERLCFDCAYWKQWMKHPEPETIIVSGCVYKQSGPLFKPKHQQLRANAIKFLMDKSTRNVYGCLGLALRGRIPHQFSKLLPDQFQFISSDTYQRINGFEAEMCLSKGCFDRYHCIWYNSSVAEPEEPWNTIPKNYQIGSENCPSFVNKYDFDND